MNRIKKLKLNALTSLIHRIVILTSGLIITRLILFYYGSKINGLISSINQYLSIITFLDLGVGAVVQSALYKPLAKKDKNQIDLVLTSAKKFFQKIAFLLSIYVIILMVFIPISIKGEGDLLATAFLILALSINLFAQYYFGIINELLLNADQKAYVQLVAEILTIVLNLIATVLLITNGFSIITVKLVTGIIYLLRPVFLKYYVDKNYNINFSVKVNEEPLQQRWNGMAQHVASVVLNSADIVLLSIFSTLENISIYSIYNMVISGVKMVVLSLITGTQSFFGNLLAHEETDLLNFYFTRIEWLVHTTVIYLFGMTAVLINSFVGIYTSGVSDANYYAPGFSLILVLAQAVYCLRLPYNSMVLAAGHYRQTQHSAIIEMIINIAVSLAMVINYGLIGVALGTLCALSYRTTYLAWYLSKDITYRPFVLFCKHIFVDVITFGVMYVFSASIDLNIENFQQWIFSAIIFGVLFLIISLIINILFYKEMLSYYIKRVFKFK